MSGRRESEKMNDPFLRNYDDAEVGIAAEFLSNWLPFLSRGLCKSCTQTLSDGVRSLHTGNFAASSTPDDIHPNGCNEDEGNCTAHSGGSTKDGPHSDDCADMHSVGSWKDEDDMNFEPTVEASPTTPIASRVSKKSWADIAQEDELAAEEENEMSGRRMNADDYSTPMNEVKAEAENEMSRRRINGDDCSVERTPMDEVKAVEENEMSSRRINTDDCSVEGTPTNEVKAKVALSRDQREDIRFNNVQRKKDFVLVERIEGKQVNILDGLELHKGVFSAAEQKRIVDYVEQLRVMGSNGQLKDRTYTAPQKWMRGKGRITLQFGCCYNYATDKNRNPPGILRKEMVDPLPQLFKVMIKRLIRWCVLPPSCVPDSCIVNIYEEGDCIPPHIDNHDFLRPFCTVSFLSECEILFGSNLKILGPGEFAGSYAIPLPVGSVLVINGNGADVAKHCVPAVPSKRISITFRKMDELKRPSGYVPEPDLQGLQPLSDDSDRSKKDDSASRARRLMGNPTLAGSEDRVNRGRGIGSGPLWARHLDSYRSGRSSQGPADRRRPRLDLEN